MENLNPSPSARSLIYLLAVFVNATYAVVSTEVHFSIWVVGVVAGFNALVAALAKANVSEK